LDSGAIIESYASIARRILAKPSGFPRLIAVDGPGGAGKSVFAARLAAALGSAPVVQTDDFATGAPGDVWWPRLESQVIRPLSLGLPARYQRFDWHRRGLAEWREVQPGAAVIVEGVSSARRASADKFAMAIWVHAPRATRLARGLDRDGLAARADWERWMAEEDVHFQRDRTIDRCALIVDGSPTVPHDPTREFVRLSGVPCISE
jgi:hypothetical protein